MRGQDKESNEIENVESDDEITEITEQNRTDEFEVAPVNANEDQTPAAVIDAQPIVQLSDLCSDDDREL